MADVHSQLHNTTSCPGSGDEEIDVPTLRKDGVSSTCEEVESGDENEAEEIFEDASDKSPSSPRPLLPILVSSTSRPPDQKWAADEHQSLLHRKLRDRNERFQKELISLNRNPYKDAVRTIEESSSAATRSLKVMEDSSSKLKRLRDDMYLLKVAFDRLLINSSVLPRLKTTQKKELDGSLE